MWYKYIFAGKKEVLQILDGKIEDYNIISSNIQDSKLQPVAAYFYKQNINMNQLSDVLNQLSEILQRKPIEIQYTQNGIKFGNEIFNNWLRFSEKVHSIHSLFEDKANDGNKINDSELPLQDNAINIIKSQNVSDAIRLGSGTKWCISQLGNTMYQSYRDRQGSTFYFVFDGFQPENSPLRRVVVDITKNGVLLTDLKNNTGNITEFGRNVKGYFEYLQKHGVDISQFKNDPVTQEEQWENRILSQRNENIDWFKKLSYDYKSKYIGRGHRLTKDQFNYLIEHNAESLIKQYITTGIEISPEQKSMLKPNLLNSYNRTRDIYVNNLLENTSVQKLFTSTNSRDVIQRLVTKGVDLTTPENALQYAKYVKGSYELRINASQDPKCAYYYALHVDGSPSIITKNGVSKDVYYNTLYQYKLENILPTDEERIECSKIALQAYDFAEQIDESPHDITRIGASKDPKIAYEYAKDIDGEPHDITRIGASRNPNFAYEYAKDIDQEESHSVTRTGACQNAITAFKYAQKIDRGPTKETREASSTDPEYALQYAIEIDKKPHDVTRAGACQDPKYALQYAIEVDEKPTQQTYQSCLQDNFYIEEYKNYFELRNNHDKMV